VFGSGAKREKRGGCQQRRDHPRSTANIEAETGARRQKANGASRAKGARRRKRRGRKVSFGTGKESEFRKRRRRRRIAELVVAVEDGCSELLLLSVPGGLCDGFAAAAGSLRRLPVRAAEELVPGRSRRLQDHVAVAIGMEFLTTEARRVLLLFDRTCRGRLCGGVETIERQLVLTTNVSVGLALGAHDRAGQRALRLRHGLRRNARRLERQADALGGCQLVRLPEPLLLGLLLGRSALLVPLRGQPLVLSVRLLRSCFTTMRGLPLRNSHAGPVPASRCSCS